MSHPALVSGSTAVVTGGASGIGRAIALRLARIGMAVAVADTRDERLLPLAEALTAAGARDVMTAAVDVSDRAAVTAFEAQVAARFGGCDILFDNAGIQPGSSMFGPDADWDRVLAVNLMGIVHVARVFGPRMIARGRPGLIVVTGSKQGITTPPGDPAYNVAKAGVKAFTEALAHELRNTEGCRINAHLLIPGFVFTELNAGGRTEKPAGAWTPEQMTEFLFERLEAGDFYILCPDNDVPRALDEKRMLWAMGDIIENRPALSRWHPDWAAAFEAHVKGDVRGG